MDALEIQKSEHIIGLIGGSSFERGLDLDDAQEAHVETPHGPTSSPITTGRYNGVRVAFISRHGASHTIPPNKVPNLANMWALKHIGVRAVIGLSAVGSLQEGLKPGSLAIPKQLMMWGSHDPGQLSYFEKVGMAVHTPVADPFCEELRQLLLNAAMPEGLPVQEAGTIVVIPGPRFSTRAESILFRALQCDLIGMTSGEALVARQAQMPYVTLAGVTDYDSWHQEHEVTAAAVTEVMAKNVVSARHLLAAALPSLAELLASLDCPCRHALEGACMTPEEAIPAAMLEQLRFLRQ